MDAATWHNSHRNFGRHQAQKRVVLLTANIAVADCRGIKINTNTPRHSPVRLEFIDLIIGYHRTGQFAGYASGQARGKPDRQTFLGSGKSASSCGITLSHSLRHKGGLLIALILLQFNQSRHRPTAAYTGAIAFAT